VLGDTGRNFAAGMSGGIAYVYDVKENLLITAIKKWLTWIRLMRRMYRYYSK
jgi:Glutamate synthase domain 3